MSVEPPLAPPPAPPRSPAPTDRLRQLAQEAGTAIRSGWGRASVAAAVVAVIGYALNLLLAWLQQSAASNLLARLGPPAAEAADLVGAPGAAKSALLSLMFWHGVSAQVEVALPTGQVPLGSAIEVGANVTLMLGLAAIGWLLFRAGKQIAGREPAAGWFAGARGLQIALVYGAILLLLGILARSEISLGAGGEIGDAPQSVSVSPSLIGAFFMPFLIALLAACTGALSGIQAERRPARLVLGAMAGGWRSAWLAVTLASIGFLIVAALNPDVTRSYLQLIPGGGPGRALLVVSTLLILPNVGTGIAAAAMGGSINLAAAGGSCAVISYLQFPGGVLMPGSGQAPPTTPFLGQACGLPLDMGPAPFQYLLFLLVPLAATIAGGWLAAQRSATMDTEEGAVAGALIALPYALSLWALGLVARIGYAASAGVFPIEFRVWVGPGLLSTVLVALVWGAAGGAIGGALGARNARGSGETPDPRLESSV